MVLDPSPPPLLAMSDAIFQVPERDANLSGTWKLKLAKPTVEGTRTVGSISTRRCVNEVCAAGILLYQFTTSLYLAERDGWVQQKHF